MRSSKKAVTRTGDRFDVRISERASVRPSSFAPMITAVSCWRIDITRGSTHGPSAWQVACSTGVPITHSASRFGGKMFSMLVASPKTTISPHSTAQLPNTWRSIFAGQYE